MGPPPEDKLLKIEKPELFREYWQTGPGKLKAPCHIDRAGPFPEDCWPVILNDGVWDMMDKLCDRKFTYFQGVAFCMRGKLDPATFYMVFCQEFMFRSWIRDFVHCDGCGNEYAHAFATPQFFEDFCNYMKFKEFVWCPLCNDDHHLEWKETLQDYPLPNREEVFVSLKNTTKNFFERNRTQKRRAEYAARQKQKRKQAKRADREAMRESKLVSQAQSPAPQSPAPQSAGPVKFARNERVFMGRAKD
eukprot:CAMPEP_0175167058 /NCGR_PEP_ID=MMETSP0087-20121206/28093_1 /TAXON_ID=136419 /ORGANISM="Unknown Unknown, Strain D1" /LENGTH=246 /DNA_ID=CAMNT_0016456829 /DNA_START=171 /DNA_END=911 /DNA_ORIENTATION=-